MREQFRIWFGFLGGALAWTLHLLGAYGLSEGFCRSGLQELSLFGFSAMLWGLILLTLLALAGAAASFWVARSLHRSSLAGISGGSADINLFMARISLLANALFLGVIISQTFPILILGRNC